MNWLTQSVGDIARELPGATGVFHGYGLDFCCGGKQALARAVERKGVDAEALTAELDRLHAQADGARGDWADADNAELIEHILTRYHDVHREQLPELIRLSQRVELVHGGHPECPSGLASHLEGLLAELENHMAKEEQILFPMISRGMLGMAGGPVGMMRHEHDEHAQGLARIHELTRGINLPVGACNTWRALYLGLATFEVDLMDHIHLENNILFDRIDGQGAAAHG
ncbi:MULTISPECIES: iron-sulfur cluster repair protein YtfE [unclassified Marinimicrobium]|jgi:regulator of cell morphogenesis and NO signaling|uniref:iron-sulfur cluster repair protein YtfE n=1 Tax=Marinimicrobium TaxID=359337 RepID=UPI00257F280F|nr:MULTISPECIES: iron-sulfur cluster repair protein YtfE [unclassified Marinimicrobium]|tara:strand:+ start:423 stop:1106 length:684 start_codon:yes stop_codon:yes gene_type:complete